MRMARNGSRFAARPPNSTVGTSTMSMPSVVPATTGASMPKRDARMAVATWVLSPISARKNATAVTTNTPCDVVAGASSSPIASGLSAQTATAKNDNAIAHCSQSAGTTLRSTVPT
jgi:hypothetical protein